MVQGALSFELDLSASKPVLCLRVLSDRTSQATRKTVFSHSFNAWGAESGVNVAVGYLKMAREIGNDRKLSHKGAQQCAQLACRALGTGQNLQQLALGSSKGREEGFSGH